MKKIISVILSAAMLSSMFCMTVSAAEEESYKYKLGSLIEVCYGFYSQWGNPIVYLHSSDVLVAVSDVYQDPKSTELDYKNALNNLKKRLDVIRRAYLKITPNQFMNLQSKSKIITTGILRRIGLIFRTSCQR